MNSPGGSILHPNPSPSPIADGQFGGVLAVCIQNLPCATPGRPYRVRVSVNVNRCIFIPHHFLGFSWVIQLVQSRAQHVGVPRGSQSHIKAFHLPPSTAPTTASDSTLWENAGGSSDHLAQAHKHYQYAMCVMRSSASTFGSKVHGGQLVGAHVAPLHGERARLMFWFRYARGQAYSPSHSAMAYYSPGQHQHHPTPNAK